MCVVCCTLVTVLAACLALFVLDRLRGPNAFPWWPDDGAFGWATAGHTAGAGSWCGTPPPAADWSLRHCEAQSGKPFTGAPVHVKVLTYNLFWWNLFDKRKGNGGSAGNVIAAAGPFDFMGFQECGDVQRVLSDAGLSKTHAAVPATDNAVAVAYRVVAWELLRSGVIDVAEDAPDQWYGRRSVVWARFRHRSSGLFVFFANHHGPLPVRRPGGKCGPDATAYNLLKVFGYFAHPGDRIILVGDFNAGSDSETVKKLSQYMDHAFNGVSFGGVDNFFTTCTATASTKNLGGGGSDHDALSAVFRI